MTRPAPSADLDARRGDGSAAGLARELVTRVSDGLRQRAGGWQSPPREAVDGFCDSLLGACPDAGAAHVSALQARGVSLDAIYSGWLAGAAMELGRRWDEDELGFADVALGMTRLQRLLRELGPAYVGPGRGNSANAPLAFLASAPGERHIFGPVMFADHLRRLGWQVRLDLSSEQGAAVIGAAAARPAAIGISAGSRVVTEPLRLLVADLRRAAPGARIVIGGALAKGDPGAAAAACGADAAATTAQEFEIAAAQPSPSRHGHRASAT